MTSNQPTPKRHWLGPQDRPRRGWVGFICRFLPEQPDSERLNEYDHRDVFRPVTDRLIALGSILGVVAMFFVGRWLFPVLGMSPFGQAIDASAGDDPTKPSVLSIVLVLGLFLVLTALALFAIFGIVTGKMFSFFYPMALAEEHWFRAGAEDWTIAQRIKSCALFGVAHLLNLIVAYVTLGALAIVGGVFMAVYLHELRSSGDRGRALVRAAAVHAQYNVYAVCFFVVMFLRSIVVLFT